MDFDFWMGALVGLIVGGAFGVLGASLMVMARDERE